MKIAYSNKPLDFCSNLNSHQIPSYHSIIEIHVSCQNLTKIEDGNGINPMIVFFCQENDKFVEEDRTEVIKNNSSPNFNKTFKVYYKFNVSQPLRFDVYDCDSNQSSFKIQDFIGYYETDIYNIISNLNKPLTFDLLNDKKEGKVGQIILNSQQSKESNFYLLGELQVNKLKKMKTFAKNRPFYEISRPTENGVNFPVYRSKIKDRCQSCAFKEFMIPLHVLCSQKIDEPITIAFYDYRSKKTPKFIGKFENSIRNFIGTIKTHFDLKGEIQGQSVGNFCFNKLEIIQIPTLPDYLKSGINLNMITAIDFTRSNGDPKSDSSLHFISQDPNKLNQYQQSIMSVGSVLAKYSSKQNFSVFGFGAKLNKKVSHCFNLTFDSEKTEVNGLKGIIDAYNQAVPKVTFCFSTHFASVIKEAEKIAIERYNESKTYSILLILTDSSINDMQETINEIVDASDAPLSILIVGIGNSNLTNMHKLDDDDNPLRSSDGKLMKRSIVKFVPFNEFKDYSSTKLENEILEEIPFQIHQFCSTHGFIPTFEKNNFSCFL